jgi:SAM-dependent methyltransferase
MFPTARSLLIRTSLHQLPLQDFESVLIVGAGDDPYRELFAHAKRYLTLDLINHPGTDIIANAQTLPFRSNSFDCLLASEVVEHLMDPQSFIAEAHRVLVPGGKIVLTVPFMFHSHADPHDYWRLTREGFHRACSGFSSIEIYAQGNRLHVMSDLVTTAFSPQALFFPLRAVNHLFRLTWIAGSLRNSRSSAPSGFLVVANK